MSACCPGASSRCRISICGPRCRRKRTEPLKSETMQGIRAYLQPGKAACSTYPPRGALRFFRRHVRTNLFLDQHFKVRMNLLVEVSLQTPKRKEIAQKTSDLYKKRHTNYLSTTLPKLERWPKRYGPIAWSPLRAASILPWTIGSIWRGGYSRTLPEKMKSNPLL